MQNESATQCALGWEALRLLAGTPLAPTLGERKLLVQFLHGVITLAQVRALADDRLQTAQAMNKLRQLVAGAST